MKRYPLAWPRFGTLSLCTKQAGQLDAWIARAACIGLTAVCLSCGGGPRFVTIDLAEIVPPGASELQERPELVSQGLQAEYFLDVGDRIRVEFFYYPDRTRDLTVRPDGRVTLPGMGDVMAAGRTPRDLAEEIRTHFAAVLRNPTVAVVVVSTMSVPKVFVIGMVVRPGPVEYTRSLSAATAISEAGGPTEQARLGNVLLLRRISARNVAATELDLKDVFSGDDPGADVYLEQFDILYVPKSRINSIREFVLDLARILQPWILYVR